MSQNAPSRITRQEYILFGTTIFILIALGLWWITLMGRAIKTEDAYNRLQIQYEAVVLAQTHSNSTLEHAYLEIQTDSNTESGWRTPVLHMPDHYIGIKKSHEVALDKTFVRRKFMIYGEGVLLIGLLGVCAFMLLRLVTIRKSVQNEMEMFVGQMTHEMKTPLAGLRALLQTLQKGAIPPEKMQKVLDMGLQQIDREEHLVQTLLHAQQLRISEKPFAKEPFGLLEFVSKFIKHRISARNSDPESYVTKIDEMFRCVGDQQAALTILENIADNAEKYGATKLVFEALSDRGKIKLSLIDNGQGFDQRTALHLFEPYVRGSKTDGQHGTGLGLHISRRLAQAMGGDLIGRSDGIGKGAVFILSLPEESL